MGSPTAEVTRLLRAWGGGDHAALDQLTPLVYRELQVVGAPLSENLLLAVGKEFQARTDWHKRRPPGV